MTEAVDSIKAYYDENVGDKLRDYAYGNPRIERAWDTILRWAPNSPERILEIGCGIGHVSDRLARQWPRSKVVGLDLSDQSIRTARALFPRPNVSFVEGPLSAERTNGNFDLVVMMDVYEHISHLDRANFNRELSRVISRHCRVLLMVPSPQMIAWSKQNAPHAVQPIDEEVTVEVLTGFARTLELDLLYYELLGVWNTNEYFHAVLGDGRDIRPIRQTSSRSIWARVRQGVSTRWRLRKISRILGGAADSRASL